MDTHLQERFGINLSEAWAERGFVGLEEGGALGVLGAGFEWFTDIGAVHSTATTANRPAVCHRLRAGSTCPGTRSVVCNGFIVICSQETSGLAEVPSSDGHCAPVMVEVADDLHSVVVVDP